MRDTEKITDYYGLTLKSKYMMIDYKNDTYLIECETYTVLKTKPHFFKEMNGERVLDKVVVEKKMRDSIYSEITRLIKNGDKILKLKGIGVMNLFLLFQEEFTESEEWANGWFEMLSDVSKEEMKDLYSEFIINTRIEENKHGERIW